jgi:hypothetical protein
MILELGLLIDYYISLSAVEVQYRMGQTGLQKYLWQEITIGFELLQK